MKINLTKLLEKSDVKTPHEVQYTEITSASYYMKAVPDITSPERTYSFELEKETFVLDK